MLHEFIPPGSIFDGPLDDTAREGATGSWNGLSPESASSVFLSHVHKQELRCPDSIQTGMT
jgi:hypothetical protein